MRLRRIVGLTLAGLSWVPVVGAQPKPPAPSRPPLPPRACLQCACDAVIRSLPHSIQRPGRYCLDQDLQTPASIALDILADDVTLDLRGYRVAGTLGAATQAIGIHAMDRKRLIVRNGTVTGFERGVYLIGPAAREVLVEGVRAVANTYAGIQVFAGASTVRGCTVLDTGGSAANPQIAIGINVAGDGSQVLDNFVFHTTAAGAGGWAAGIQNDQAQGIVLGNRVIAVSGGAANYGIHCNGGGVVRLVRDNSVIDAATPFSTGCTLAGSTNYP